MNCSRLHAPKLPARPLVPYAEGLDELRLRFEKPTQRNPWLRRVITVIATVLPTWKLAGLVLKQFHPHHTAHSRGCMEIIPITMRI